MLTSLDTCAGDDFGDPSHGGSVRLNEIVRLPGGARCTDKECGSVLTQFRLQEVGRKESAAGIGQAGGGGPVCVS